MRPKKVLQWQVQDPMFTIIKLLLQLHVYIILSKYHISKSSKHHGQNFEKSSLVIESVNHFVSQCKYLITPQVSPKSTSSCAKHHSLMLLSPPLKVSIFFKIHFYRLCPWIAGAHGCYYLKETDGPNLN